MHDHTVRVPWRGRQPAPRDAELLRSAEPAAFGRLYSRHHRAVEGRLLAWTASPTLAADLATETFITAFLLRGRFDPTELSARGWLLGIARNHLRHAYRRAATEQRAVARLLQVGGWREIGSDIATDADAVRTDDPLLLQLRSGVARLAPSTRDAVLLRVVAGRSYREISVLLGCTSGAARTRVCRGLAALAADEQLCAAWERAKAV